MLFTRHGLSGTPDQLRPTTVPMRQSGKETKSQMKRTSTMEPKGTAASEWYMMAMVLRTKAMPNTTLKDEEGRGWGERGQRR